MTRGTANALSGATATLTLVDSFQSIRLIEPRTGTHRAETAFDIELSGAVGGAQNGLEVDPAEDPSFTQ